MPQAKKILSEIKEKPYFIKDSFVLFHNDCLKILEQIPDNSIDMIFADPPYFLSSGSFTCHNGKMVSVKKGDWDLSNGTRKNFEFHLAWTKACRRVLKPGGTIWISGTYHSIYQCGFALEINGFHILCFSLGCVYCNFYCKKLWIALEGIKILDLSRLLPFNYCTLMLADLGAQVLKIEEPKIGDYMRWMPPKLKKESAVFLMANRNKKRACLEGLCSFPPGHHYERPLRNSLFVVQICREDRED